jgi:uncharacterized phage infection (PIP) family protein YhgE
MAIEDKTTNPVVENPTILLSDGTRLAFDADAVDSEFKTNPALALLSAYLNNLTEQHDSAVAMINKHTEALTAITNTVRSNEVKIQRIAELIEQMSTALSMMSKEIAELQGFPSQVFGYEH